MASIQEELERATSSGDHSMQEKCIWGDLFSDEHKQFLNDSLLLIGTVTTAATTGLLYCWTFLILKNHINECSYRNLFNYAVSMHLRLIIPFTFNFLKDFFDVWFLSGRFCAFVETFLQILEIEALTHLCIERYVYAKYITNGWHINREYYTLFIYLCFFFAGLYSIPPLLGIIGDYALDFSCDNYTMDMILPSSWKRYFILAFFVLKSVKPAFMTAAMLNWARKLEVNYTPQMKKRGDLHYTQLVIRIAMWNYCLWMPMAFVRGFVLLTQLLWGEMMTPHPDTIRWANWMYEVSPLCVTGLILMEDQRLKNRCKPAVRYSDNEDNDETASELKED